MKIAVLVSGGVDSSVALKRLVDEGHEVTAFYLKIWLADELAFLGSCPWQEDLEFAQAVCTKLNVPLQVVSMQEAYWQEVVSYTLAEVKAGRTPNPDVLCNERIKFGAFLKTIDASYEKVASGHYAQVMESSEGYKLVKAKDSFKDQTYFLAHLNQAQMSRVLFPIGDLLKKEVRELAATWELANKNRKDSQGICFLGSIDFEEFIRFHVGDTPGDLVAFETGKIIGTHKGFWYYTIGQRKGIGLSHGPWYVVQKDTTKNIVYISNQYFSPDKSRNHFYATDLHWIGQSPVATHLQVKLRHGEYLYDATITVVEGKAEVTLNTRDQGIAAGQFVVFYEQEVCLGCGVISFE